MLNTIVGRGSVIWACQLKYHNMLLITTSHSVIILDTEDFRAWRVAHRDGLYYGVAKKDEYLYVAARGRMVSSNIPPKEERGKIIVFDKWLRKVDELSAPFPLRDMHQITWVNDCLWVTCSYDNKIAIYDGENWEEWYPLGKPLSEPYDINHFNSISAFGDDVCIVAHNKGDSELYFFDIKTREQKKVFPLGVAAHNVWMDGSSIFTCSSGEGKVVGSDGAIIPVGGFPRGIIFKDKRIYLGISELAERNERDFTDGCLKVYNNTWDELNTIHLPGEGLVLDIMEFDISNINSFILKFNKMFRWKKIKLDVSITTVI